MGGQNVLNSTLNMTYESFDRVYTSSSSPQCERNSPQGGNSYDQIRPMKKKLEQVNLAEQLTSSDFGVSTGLISQGYWEVSKWYFVNVERGNISIFCFCKNK